MNKYLSQSALDRITIDSILLVGFNFIMLLIFFRIDLLEWLYEVSLQYEDYELDEIVPLFFTLSISLVVFATRRIFELKEQHSKLVQIANHDPLTGLCNRRYIQDALLAEIERSKRTKNDFSVIIIDIDDFKKVNDTHGHNVGDKILTQFSEIFLEITRKIDIVSRWGGEEFLILCTETPLAGAAKTAERLIKAINRFRFDVIGHATASMGVVSSKENEGFESIIHRADVCLYEAKAKNKNCFVIG